MKTWTRHGERRLLHTRLFDVDEVLAEHPERGDDVPFLVIRTGDWVNVIPVTEDGRVVLIRQYRPGTHEISLEIPGGMIDPGEAPRVAAARELAEETGYVPAALEELGCVTPNPAILDNRCYTFLATGCARLRETRFDDDEKIEVTTASLDEIPALIQDGRIDHSLVVAAFYHLFVARERLGTPP